MVHRANASFWKAYDALPAEIRSRADKQFALLKADPLYPSLRFKKIGEREGHEVWSARITLKYRALAIKLPDEFGSRSVMCGTGRFIGSEILGTQRSQW
jgi:hypothetical protein